MLSTSFLTPIPRPTPYPCIRACASASHSPVLPMQVHHRWRKEVSHLHDALSPGGPPARLVLTNLILQNAKGGAISSMWAVVAASKCIFRSNIGGVVIGHAVKGPKLLLSKKQELLHPYQYVKQIHVIYRLRLHDYCPSQHWGFGHWVSRSRDLSSWIR